MFLTLFMLNFLNVYNTSNNSNKTTNIPNTITSIIYGLSKLCNSYSSDNKLLIYLCPSTLGWGSVV